MISGAAYFGDPQNVSKKLALSYMLLRPKSMSLTSLPSFSRTFSARIVSKTTKNMNTNLA